MSLKPEYKEALVNALENFTLHVQFSNDYYMETKLRVARSALAELKSDMKIDIDWVYSNNGILQEAIVPYREFLKRRIAESMPGDEDVEVLKNENLLLVRIESKINEFQVSVMNSDHV